VAGKLVKLTKHTRHSHKPSPIVPHFIAPPVCKELSFRPIALAAAVARTSTTWEEAPKKILDGLQKSALAELDAFLQDGSIFALDSYFINLADVARSQFATKVGAGITHLYMEAIGYAWRANAVCLSSSHDPHADFIYDGGNAAGLGVVLAEAHGSFAQNLTSRKITSAAKRKYETQVKPYISGPSMYGQIIHGYSVAFGSKPTEAGSFLSVSETRISKQKKPSLPPPASAQEKRPDGTPTPILLATHRSNFLLMGAPEVVDWIDWLRVADRPMPKRKSVLFLRLQYAGRDYLTSWPRLSRAGAQPCWYEELIFYRYWLPTALNSYPPGLPREVADIACFAMEERGARSFLTELSAAIRGGRTNVPLKFVLPTFNPVGFGFADYEEHVTADLPYDYTQFRDGLALLGNPFRGHPHGVVVWSPDKGITDE
jgi:hypothetical protein